MKSDREGLFKLMHISVKSITTTGLQYSGLREKANLIDFYSIVEV